MWRFLDRRYRTGLFCLIAALLSACKPPEHPVAPPLGPVSCEGVCERARALKCSWGNPTAAGAQCSTVCQNIQESGFIAWNLNCRAHADSCDAMDVCER